MKELSYSNQVAYEKKMRKMLESGRFVAFSQIASDYHKLLMMKEEVKLSELEISEQDKDQANIYLRVICILTDIVEKAGIDLLSLIKKYDKWVELPMVLLLKHLQKTAQEVNKIIDAVGDERYACSFGDIVDEVEPLIYDTIQEIFNERRV